MPSALPLFIRQWYEMDGIRVDTAGVLELGQEALAQKLISILQTVQPQNAVS